MYTRIVMNKRRAANVNDRDGEGGKFKIFLIKDDKIWTTNWQG